MSSFYVGEINEQTASQEYYHTITNDLYADGNASTNYDYTKRGPEVPPDDENYAYVRTVQPDESEAPAYDTTSTLTTSK